MYACKGREMTVSLLIPNKCVCLSKIGQVAYGFGDALKLDFEAIILKSHWLGECDIQG